MIHISKGASSKITNIENANIQPNAVDLCIDSVELIDALDLITLDDKITKHAHTTKLEVDDQGYYHLQQGKAYGITLSHECSISSGEAGFIITRSSLNRNGIFIKSGLYDSGFNNVMGATLYTNGCRIKIKRGSRVAQFVLFKAETSHLYDGQYNKI